MHNDTQRLQIALLTALDARDRRSWSGTFYSIAQALQKYCGDVTHIGPLSAANEMFVGRITHAASHLLLGKRFLFRHSHAVSMRYARVAAERLAARPFDVVVALSGSTEIAFLKTTLPIVLVEDANFPLLQGYHQHFSALLECSARQVNDIQSRGIHNADLLLYATSWAAKAAIEYYDADPRKVRIIPFGANLEHIPARETVLARQKGARCELLFVGVNWERKGGDIAFETLCALEASGIEASLTVCGCTPPRHIRHPRLTVIPFLDKNNAEQCKRLEALYLSSAFLLLPTRNECFGVALCEANAYGLPVVTTHTGGVPEVVRNGENGFTLPYTARGKEYARTIARIYQDEELYLHMTRQSRAAFEERLNWDRWGLATREALLQMLQLKEEAQPLEPQTLSQKSS